MEKRCWGIELWDQADALIRHENEQSTFDDQYIRFMSELQRTVLDFSKKYRKLVTNFSFKKRPPENLTYNSTLIEVLKSLQNTGTTFEQYAVDLQKIVVETLKKENDAEKKCFEKTSSEFTKLSNAHEQERKQVDEAWRSHFIAFKDKLKAEQLNTIAQSDNSLPREELFRTEQALENKINVFKKSEQTYAAAVEAYVKYKNHFYSHHVHQILTELESLSYRRELRTKTILTTFTNLEQTLSRRIGEDSDARRTNVLQIDPVKDRAAIIASRKSGYMYPVDLPFVSLDLCPAPVLENQTALLNYILGTQRNNSTPNQNSSGFFSLKLGKSRAQASDCFRTAFIGGLGMNPIKMEEMTITQVNDRIRMLKEQRDKVNHIKNSTTRLQETYEKNPNLGDSTEAQHSVEKLERQLFSLTDLIGLLEIHFEKLGGDHALSQSQSFHNFTSSNQKTLDEHNNLPSSVLNVTRSESSFSDFGSDEESSDIDAKEEDIRKDLRPVSCYVASATAKYDYDGAGNEYLATHVGQIFYVVGLDTDSSGWTPVVSQDGSQHGFVPTAYIDIEPY